MMDFKGAFDRMINGTYAITVKSDGASNAMTAAWVSRVSHQPPLVAVSIGLKRYTHELVAESGAFCVNILSESQLELGKKFGLSSGRDADKLCGIRHSPGRLGCPIIEECAGYLECRVVDSFLAGDHTIFVGEVVSAGHSDSKGLVARMEDYF